MLTRRRDRYTGVVTRLKRLSQKLCVFVVPCAYTYQRIFDSVSESNRDKFCAIDSRIQAGRVRYVAKLMVKDSNTLQQTSHF